MNVEAWIKPVLAIAALCGMFYGTVEWHERFALASTVSIIQVRQDLRDATSHYYIVYQAQRSNPADPKLKQDLKRAEREKNRLETLLDNLKNRRNMSK